MGPESIYDSGPLEVKGCAMKSLSYCIISVIVILQSSIKERTITISNCFVDS